MLFKDRRGVYQLSGLKDIKGLVHGFSTRSFGDMRTNSKDLVNRESFTKALGISPKFVSGEQVHGNKVTAVGKRDIGKIIPGVDGIVTSESGVNLLVLTADCLPIIAYDPNRKIIGVAHAGWKGTVRNVSKNLIKKFSQEFGSEPSKLKIGFGPCIEFCHYEVDKDRVNEIEKANLSSALMKTVSGKTFFDIKSANIKQMLSTGVVKSNIDVSIKSCTFENPDFYSWRREKPNLSGNFAAIIAKGRF